MVFRIYYIIFAQINLFTLKLRWFSSKMFKREDIREITIDDLLFESSSELSDLFLAFFEEYAKNRENNSYDMTDSIESITSQLKKPLVFRKRFNENFVDSIEKAFKMHKTSIMSNEYIKNLEKSLSMHTQQASDHSENELSKSQTHKYGN